MLKRTVTVFSVFVFSLSVLIVRLLTVEMNHSSFASETVNGNKKVVLSVSRGCIYDRNMNKLVNENTVGKKYELNHHVFEYSFVERYSDPEFCSHIIGYINSDSEGISGIEKSYNSLLKQFGGEQYISYSSNALGGFMGSVPCVKENNFLSDGGIVLTLDKTIQEITEKCVDDGSLDKGAAVVMDVKTSEILAVVSRPAFDRNNLSDAVNNENSPLINRAFGNYSVGSVFKPLIAASVLENSNYDINAQYKCVGNIKIGDSVFYCHKKDGHGNLDFNKAMAFSCNTFFINMTKNIDIKDLLYTAEMFGINERFEIADGMYIDEGVLPEINSSAGEKANFSFGQGKLLASPVHLAAAYAAIGNKGIYNPPLIVKAQVDRNKIPFKAVKPYPSRRVISENNAQIIMDSLKLTVEEGSGINAKPENTSAVGKTATAQSGWYSDEKEINHSWFIGMFPADNPKYVVVILKENGSSGSKDCAPIFRDIALLITAYE